MLQDLIFIVLFGLGIVYYLFSVLCLLAKPNKSDFEKLELNYHAALLAILILALISCLRTIAFMGIGH